MRLERLSEEQEDHWRGEFAGENWLIASLAMSLTLPEYANGRPKLESMPFGYYLQPLHLTVYGREDLPRKLLWVLAHRRPPVDFLEMVGAGIRIPHAFPQGFTLESVLRITLQELRKLPIEG